jgi:hypothetical protein
MFCFLAVAVHHLCLDELLQQCTAADNQHLFDARNSSCQAVAQSTASTGVAAGEAEQQHGGAQQHSHAAFTAEAWQVSHLVSEHCRGHNITGWPAVVFDRSMLMLLCLQASRHRLLQATQLRLQQYQQQQQHGQQRMVLLVDDINHYRSMRYEFVQLARARELAICADTATLFGGISCSPDAHLTLLLPCLQMALRSCSSTWSALW